MKKKIGKADKETLDRLANIKPGEIHCAFCGLKAAEVKKMVGGPSGACICDECINLAVELIEESK